MAQKFPYEDIVDLPPHISKKHPQPTMLERAARFSPFAAITGYEEMVKEAARVTDKKIELDEGDKEILNEKLLFVTEMCESDAIINITYFIPDSLKSGGRYTTVSGSIKRIDEYERKILFTDGTTIPIDDIYQIDGDMFNINDFVW